MHRTALSTLESGPGYRPSQTQVGATIKASAGLVTGLDRGLMAMVNETRTRPRKTIDGSYNDVIIGERMSYLQYGPPLKRFSSCTKHSLVPSASSIVDMLPAASSADNPIDNICTRLAFTGTNQARSEDVTDAPINDTIGMAQGNCHKLQVTTVDFEPNGYRLFTGGDLGRISWWNGPTGGFDSRIKGGHTVPIKILRWQSDGKFMLVGDVGGNLKVWTPHLWVGNEVVAHQDAVQGIAIAPGNKKFATIGAEGVVKIWDFVRTSVDHEFSGHNSDGTSVSWNRHMSLVCSTGKDGLVRLWDVNSAKEVKTLSFHTSAVQCSAWNPVNPYLLLTGSRDTTSKVMDIRKLQEPLHTWNSNEHRGVTACAWHPYSERLFAAGHSTGALQYFVLGKSYSQGMVPSAHEGTITDMCWHPQGNVAVTVGKDFTVKWWGRSFPGDDARQYAYQGMNKREMSNPVNENKVVVPGLQFPSISGAGTSTGMQFGSLSSIFPSDATTGNAPQGRSFAELVQLQQKRGEIDHETGKLLGEAAAAAAAARAVASASMHAEEAANESQYQSSSRSVPGPGYVCRLCNQSGHWIYDCEVAKQKQKDGQGGPGMKEKRPPRDSYVCVKCGIPGHWVEECTVQPRGEMKGKRPPREGYVCVKCGIPGHWKEECPNSRPATGFATGDGSYPNADGATDPAGKRANVPGTGASGKRPPGPGYICVKCNSGGHWVEECPLALLGLAGRKKPGPGYVCHICGMEADHWKQDCPNINTNVANTVEGIHVPGGGQNAYPHYQQPNPYSQPYQDPSYQQNASYGMYAQNRRY